MSASTDAPGRFGGSPGFDAFAEKMRRAELPAVVIESFRLHYAALAAGERGWIAGSEIRPVGDLPQAAALRASETPGREALDRTAIIKLNGGLGTSMGMRGAKSLLPLRGEKTFLDIIAQQVLHLRGALDIALPLLLMDSYRTRDDSLERLAAYPELPTRGLPLDFLQNKVPRIFCDNLAPATWESDRSAEWCPPGHGDLYPALASSGVLTALLEAGIEYAFVSNADNLGAVVDPGILGWFVEAGAPFAMEVCRRAPIDRKGGHLARDAAGRLLLREVAQCPPAEVASFQDISLYRYFNTNNLWLHLPSLAAELAKHGGFLPLPMIRNQKRIDSADPNSPAVFQLESAMGAAISQFDGAEAICVPRSRFAPVKTTNDLLVVASDAYALRDDSRLLPVRSEVPHLDLDPSFYATVGDLQERFPYGPPSLRDCAKLTVRGDVTFGRDVVCSGRVSIDSPKPLQIPDGERLDDSYVG